MLQQKLLHQIFTIQVLYMLS